MCSCVRISLVVETKHDQGKLWKHTFSEHTVLISVTSPCLQYSVLNTKPVSHNAVLCHHPEPNYQHCIIVVEVHIQGMLPPSLIFTPRLHVDTDGCRTLSQVHLTYLNKHNHHFRNHFLELEIVWNKKLLCNVFTSHRQITLPIKTGNTLNTWWTRSPKMIQC